MKILFIGGNGNISWWCVQKAIEDGHEVYVLNRALTRSTRRKLQPEVKEIIADVRNRELLKKILITYHFDTVCDFICFNEEQARTAINIFNGKCDQYIVLSSESVFQRKSCNIPFTEQSPKYSPSVDDPYIRGKLLMENVFIEAHKKNDFPVTIVRPGYTYDTIIRVPIGHNCFTAPKRYLEGYPLLIPGDGENIVAPLHSKDFAELFNSLIGNKQTIGEDYNIVAEKYITLNEMATFTLDALGCNNKNVLHISRNDALKITDFYSKIVNEQQMWHYIFDNKKIKAISPKWKQKIDYKEGIKYTVSWLLENKTRQRINPDIDNKLMKIYDKYYSSKM